MQRLMGMVSILIATIVSGCTASTPSTSSTAIPEPTRTVQLTVNNQVVTLHTLPGWSVFEETDRLILSEKLTPIGDAGVLNGVTVSIWLPDLETLSTDDTDANTLSEILTTIIQERQANTQLAVTEPARFVWNGYDAAYYLLNRGDDNTSLIITLELENQQFLAMNASTATTDTHRLVPVLRELYTDLAVNDRHIGSEGLHHLPQVLEVPSVRSEAAMGASEEP